MTLCQGSTRSELSLCWEEIVDDVSAKVLQQPRRYGTELFSTLSVVGFAGTLPDFSTLCRRHASAGFK